MKLNNRTPRLMRGADAVATQTRSLPHREEPMKRRIQPRGLFLAMLAMVTVMLPGAVPAAHATHGARHTYGYTSSVTLNPNSVGINQTLTVTATFTLGTATNDNWPAGYKTSTNYEIVLCPDLPGGTGFEGFNCYAVSDAAEPLVGTTSPYLAGQRLPISGGTATQFSYAAINAGVVVTMPPTRPTAIAQNFGKARISVQSVQRYGEDGNVCVAGTSTGIGVDDPGSPLPLLPTGCGTVSQDGNPVCQPFCYEYNNTPRLVGEATLTFNP